MSAGVAAAAGGIFLIYHRMRHYKKMREDPRYAFNFATRGVKDKEEVRRLEKFFEDTERENLLLDADGDSGKLLRSLRARYGPGAVC